MVQSSFVWTMILDATHIVIVYSMPICLIHLILNGASDRYCPWRPQMTPPLCAWTPHVHGHPRCRHACPWAYRGSSWVSKGVISSGAGDGAIQIRLRSNPAHSSRGGLLWGGLGSHVCPWTSQMTPCMSMDTLMTECMSKDIPYEPECMSMGTQMTPLYIHGHLR